jgi:hypothetical protein
MENK